MSVTVDLENDHLTCKTQADAELAAAIINGDEWMRLHVRVGVCCSSNPRREDAWCLEVEEYDGCNWEEQAARSVWLRIVPHLADGATLEFRGEDGSRWRVHWSKGRVFEEYIGSITWAPGHEIATEQKESAS